MKKITFLVMVSAIFIACNNQAPKTDAPLGSIDEEKLNYPYTLDHPADNWDRGDQKNVVLVLNSFKAYQDGNVGECLKYFADTVTLDFDNYHYRGPKDSVLAMFTTSRNNLASMEVKMEDWEAVTSKDKKEEWVSLWYKQKTKDRTGKMDSVYCMDDLKIVNGKIAILDQKQRHFPGNK